MSTSRAILTVLAFLPVAACRNPPVSTSAGTTQQAASPAAPAPTIMAGFDATRAYEHVRHLVALGPRPSGSEAIHQAQSYIIEQLKSYGCQVEEHDFHGSSSLGQIAMKNIIAKIPGKDPPIILYATHYDTVRIPNFVGADDGGSGTG